jgi:hypothetical protein
VGSLFQLEVNQSTDKLSIKKTKTTVQVWKPLCGAIIAIPQVPNEQSFVILSAKHNMMVQKRSTEIT